MRIAALVALVPLALLPPTTGRAAEPTCHRYDQVVTHLGRKYQEVPVGRGLQTNGQLLQLFASRRTGTWTVISTKPDGTTCVVAAGEDWEETFALQEKS
jgi:hypothetical protein